MNTETNNKLMAEFMGLTRDRPSPDMFFNMEDCPNAVSFEVKYNTDWNWLMAVVEKIESMDFVLNIRQGHVSIVNNSGKTPFYTGSDIVEESKIESVYNTCIEFIKWYNNVDNL